MNQSEEFLRKVRTLLGISETSKLLRKFRKTGKLSFNHGTQIHEYSGTPDKDLINKIGLHQVRLLDKKTTNELNRGI